MGSPLSVGGYRVGNDGESVIDVKQVIVFRRDLNMRKGKIAAQVAHASMKVFFDRKITYPGAPTGAENQDGTLAMPPQYLLVPLDPAMAQWVHGTFAKVVLMVENEADLLRCYEEAKARHLPCALVTDLGFTEFHGVPTHTAVAIGPTVASEIDIITGRSGLVPTTLA
jgi:PTH2 family peptidyl-tRNA hydrolase